MKKDRKTSLLVNIISSNDAHISNGYMVYNNNKVNHTMLVSEET